MRTSPLRSFVANSQGLSPKALKAKRARDKASAMTKKRKDRKAENQRIGQSFSSDIHHKSDGTTERVSVKNNRGNFGNGTQIEG